MASVDSSERGLFFFLPHFLRSGIFTMPGFLEYRFDVTTRTIMATFMMLAYVFVALATVLYSGALALEAVFGVDAFFELGQDKLHTVLPWNHPAMPWVAVFIGGLRTSNLFYWGLNQFITQRTLGARSLRDGQRGIVLAAALKLIIPFIIVFPGIMAAEIYGDAIANPDQAYPVMIREILPVGLTGVMFSRRCSVSS